jgi:hypothetical protein
MAKKLIVKWIFEEGELYSKKDCGKATESSPVLLPITDIML